MTAPSPAEPTGPARLEKAPGRKRLRGSDDETPAEEFRRKQRNRERRLRRRRRREPFLRLAVWSVGLLPVSVAAFLGECVGRLAYAVASYARERVLTHLRVAFGETKSEAEITALARENFRVMGRSLLALPAFVRRGPDVLLSRMEVVDGHLLTDVVAEGRGVIALTHHFGLFDAAGVWLAQTCNGVAIGRDGAEIGPTRLMIDMRERLGLTTIERGDARALVRALREGRPVGMLADHDVEDLNGVFVPFFGHMAHTPVGPATLAIRAKVPVVPTVVEWTSRSTLRLRVLGVLHPREDLPRDRAAHELTYRFTKLGEDAIRALPAHWIWIHKRWQTRPEARPDLPAWDPAVED